MNLIPEVPFPLSDPAEMIRHQLNEVWDKGQAKRDEYVAEKSRLADVPVDEVNEEHLNAIHRNDRKVLDIAQGELSILREVAETWPALYFMERQHAIDKAAEVSVKTVREIRDGLTALGFPSDPPPGYLHLAYHHLPNSHPRAVAARKRLSELQNTPLEPPCDFRGMIQEREDELRVAIKKLS